MDNLNLSIPSVQETALSPEEQIEWLYKYKESKLTAGSNIRITREGDTTVISAIGEGFSPLVTITPIEGGNRLTIVDGEGSHSCDIMDGVDGVDGVSPQIVISSITGGHSVKVIDADHPTGQTFNVLDGADGEDGSSVIVKSIDAVEGGVNVTLEDENGEHVLFLANGPQGLTGPAATVAAGTTTTIAPGGNAEVTNVGTASNAVFNFKIPAGQTGADGQDGSDGVSPEVSFTSITGGNRMTVTDATHPLGQSIDIMDGVDGTDGSDGTDGVSPEVTIGVISGGHSVTITDADHPQGQTFNVMDGENAAAATVTVGTTTTGEAGTNASVVNVGTSSDAVLNFTIPRGADGADGSDGQDGADGSDGTSAYCSVTKSGDTATITCTDANGTTTAQISDGSQGAQGNPGPAGPGVPQGGTAGQYLKKASSTDYDTEWGDVEALPSGGNNGDVLTKATTGPMWAAPVQELPAISSGDAGKVLSVNSGETGVEWATPSGGGGGDHVSELFGSGGNYSYYMNGATSSTSISPTGGKPRLIKKNIKSYSGDKEVYEIDIRGLRIPLSTSTVTSIKIDGNARGLMYVDESGTTQLLSALTLERYYGVVNAIVMSSMSPRAYKTITGQYYISIVNSSESSGEKAIQINMSWGDNPGFGSISNELVFS